MKKVESPGHAQLRRQVAKTMRLYLGQHPEEAITIALGLTDLVAQASSKAALTEWNNRVNHLVQQATDSEVSYPVKSNVVPVKTKRGDTQRKS